MISKKKEVIILIIFLSLCIYLIFNNVVNKSYIIQLEKVIQETKGINLSSNISKVNVRLFKSLSFDTKDKIALLVIIPQNSCHKCIRNIVAQAKKIDSIPVYFYFQNNTRIYSNMFNLELTKISVLQKKNYSIFNSPVFNPMCFVIDKYNNILYEFEVLPGRDDEINNFFIRLTYLTELLR